jgi:hypothetical protein
MCCLTTEQLKCPGILPITRGFGPETWRIGIPTAPGPRHLAGNPADSRMAEVSLESFDELPTTPNLQLPTQWSRMDAKPEGTESERRV